MTQIAGQIGADREVISAIVIPDGVDAVEYVASLGLAGEWVDLTGSDFGIGAVHASGVLMYRWEQIAGAALGPENNEDGFPLDFIAYHNGLAWRSRVDNNVNEPLVDVTTTWSRLDGRYVVPAGWQYQPGEDVTDDDGATWWRVVQATSFAPSAFPAAWVEIDGQGGEPIAPAVPAWVQPGGAGDAYALGAIVTHDGQTWVSGYANNVWEPGVFGWSISP